MKFKLDDVVYVFDKNHIFYSGKPLTVQDKCNTTGQWIDDTSVSFNYIKEYPVYASILDYFKKPETKFQAMDKVISVKNTSMAAEGWIGYISKTECDGGYDYCASKDGRRGPHELAFYEDELEMLSAVPRSSSPIEEIEEHTGSSVNYYKVFVANPTTLEQPYYAEANDIIESLGLTFAEGNLLKAVWRIAADRNGKKKKGNNSVYDAEKLVFFANRVLVQEKGE